MSAGEVGPAAGAETVDMDVEVVVEPLGQLGDVVGADDVLAGRDRGRPPAGRQALDRVCSDQAVAVVASELDLAVQAVVFVASRIAQCQSGRLRDGGAFDLTSKQVSEQTVGFSFMTCAYILDNDMDCVLLLRGSDTRVGASVIDPGVVNG